MKIVYLITTSEILRKAFNYSQELIYNPEKEILSCTGAEKASKLSKSQELSGLDAIYSSSYISALETAKYIARQNNLKINIEPSFNNREVGELKNKTIAEFNYQSLTNFDYKISYGESINEVKERFSRQLKKILTTNIKKIAIISHENAILSLLLNWCQVGFNYENEPILQFNNQIIHDGAWDLPEIFELTFAEDNNLLTIKNLTNKK